MQKITKMLLLALALWVMVGWSCPAHAATEHDSEPEKETGLHAVLDGCYELVDGELVAAEELGIDKVYFISATLKNVAEPTIDYWTPDPKANDELFGIRFRFNLPATVGHDTPGQVVLRATASRRNPDDRRNTSEVALEIYAQGDQTLALEFAPGYCDADTLHQINDYHYYLQSEADHSVVCSAHDSRNPIAPGAERKILLAVRTRNAQDFATKRQLEKLSYMRVDLSNKVKPNRSAVIGAIPIVGDVVALPRVAVAESILAQNELGDQKRLVVQVELPQWIEQQSGDRWWLHTKGKVYAEDGKVCFWAGLYNHEVIYDLDSTATQNVFGLQDVIVHLDSIKAWYFDEGGEKVALEVSEIKRLPELSVEADPAFVLENNGISAEIALEGDLANELAGKTIYLSYGYSQIQVNP